jgi:hypothetical protein
MFNMRRRDLITVLGGAAAAWPLVARAQQAAGRIWRLGILSPAAPPEPLVEAIRQRLGELGYIEGRNIVFEGGCDHHAQHARGLGRTERDHDHPDCFHGGW